MGCAAQVAAGIEVPPNTGTIVAAQWDFEGIGDYPVTAQPSLVDKASSTVIVKGTHAFSKPGTIFRR